MTFTTHFLASWSMADVFRVRRGDQALVTWCGVLPDADGLGLVIDGFNHVLGRPEAWYYGQYHHALLHGILGAFAIPLVLSMFATHRLRVFAICLLAAHFHLLCDVIGSRGPRATDVWPVHYLAPFFPDRTVQWSGQWPLNAWPNIVFTLLLIAFALYRAVGFGRSPMNAFGSAADRACAGMISKRQRSA